MPDFEAVAVAAPAVAVAPAGELLGAVVVPGGEGVLVAVACGRAAFALELAVGADYLDLEGGAEAGALGAVADLGGDVLGPAVDGVADDVAVSVGVDEVEAGDGDVVAVDCDVGFLAGDDVAVDEYGLVRAEAALADVGEHFAGGDVAVVDALDGAVWLQLVDAVDAAVAA